jgi:hypothetical protein
VFWTFFIFKESMNYYFLVAVIFFRCAFSFALLRDYMASWSKSTQKTFLRKVFINIPVFVIAVPLFYGHIRLSLLFSEFLFYLLLLNLSVYLYWYFTNGYLVEKTESGLSMVLERQDPRSPKNLSVLSIRFAIL